MKHVFRHIRRRSQALAQNPLFVRWLDREDIPDERKFGFMPMAIDFVMGFRDFNKYFVRYPSPSSPFEEALNSHAAEDETHSLLFLEDWDDVRVDQQLGWRPRDLYWWMTSDRTRESRALDFTLTKLVYEHVDPLLRFAIIESMEAAGHVFFKKTADIADRLSQAQGKPYRYFGRYHLERETGHLIGVDERPFLKAELDPERAAQAAVLVDRVFDVFERHFQLWEEYAQASATGGLDFDAQAEGRRVAGLRPTPAVDVSRFLSLDHPVDPTGEGALLAEERRLAFEELWRTPFHCWVRESLRPRGHGSRRSGVGAALSSPGDFDRMLRSFFLQWVVDNWTCADYFQLDTTYPAPETALERGINRLSTLYASEMNRRFVEWERLDLDSFTGWRPAEALAHYYLDPLVEGHREVFADLRKLTFKYPAPRHRYWIMKCFVRFGDAFMHSLGEAMALSRVVDEDFIIFAGFPERLHPDLEPDPEADAAIEALERAPLSPEDAAIVRAIIRETRDQEARRSALSLRVLEERRYEAMELRWRRRHGEAAERKTA
jgi:hypothetical protein